jgi:ABC-type polysaccharide/polyol phosphate export permease
LLAAAVVLAILAVALTAGGLAMAWPMTSTAAFHAIMMLILMPMWMLCGAVFPVATAPAPLKVLMLGNPLTYGYATLAAVLSGDLAGTWIMPVVVALPVTLGLTVLAITLATRIARRSRER